MEKQNDWLEAFPKQRPALSKEHQKIFMQHYIKNRNSESVVTSISSKFESWMHLKVAQDTKKNPHGSTLELGAGTLNHLPFEPGTTNYDVVEPFTDLYKNSSRKNLIRSIYTDIDEIEADKKYDRVISIATLEHLCDLPRVLAKAALKLNDGGSFRSAIPSEGTAVWRLAWTFTTGIEFRLRYGLPYAPIMRHEHVNTCFEIRNVLELLFEEVKTSYFGLSSHLSLFQMFVCKKSRLDVCQKIASA
jgi:hypothetical protein